MIYGIGADIVNVKRLEKDDAFLCRLIKRCLSENEQQMMESRGLADFQTRVLYMAKRFAAKEAVVKAMGTGFRDGIYLSDVEIINDDLGKPIVKLSGNAQLYLQKILGHKSLNIHLSLSDDYPFAQAFAIIEI